MNKDKQPLRLSLGAVVIAKGQCLRANETATATTFSLHYAAQRAQR